MCFSLNTPFLAENLPLQAQNLLTHLYHRDGDLCVTQSFSCKYFQKIICPDYSRGNRFQSELFCFLNLCIFINL